MAQSLSELESGERVKSKREKEFFSERGTGGKRWRVRKETETVESRREERAREWMDIREKERD